jgi:hypothetical protein
LKYEEQQIHKNIVKQIKARGVPGLVFWHTPNGARFGGKNPARHGAIMKSLGVRAGVSDLLFLHKGKFFAMEIKREIGGSITEPQLRFLRDVNYAGGFSGRADGYDAAIKMLEMWGLLRGVTA